MTRMPSGALPYERPPEPPPWSKRHAVRAGDGNAVRGCLFALLLVSPFWAGVLFCIWHYVL